MQKSAEKAALEDRESGRIQVGLTGSPEAVERAAEIVTQARKDLYRLLAE